MEPHQAEPTPQASEQPATSHKSKIKRVRTQSDNAHTKGDSEHRRPRTPRQLERQEQAYNLSVLFGKTVREIAAELKVNKDTVVADIRHEERRRADEIAERRAVEQARSVACYMGVIAQAQSKSSLYDKIAQKMLDNPKFAGKVTDRTCDTIIQARARIDKILGIEAPTKVEVGLEKLLESIDVPPDEEGGETRGRTGDEA